jgi:hypothetical protein
VVVLRAVWRGQSPAPPHIFRWAFHYARREVAPIHPEWKTLYLVRGIYQELANARIVGWHPRYVALLEEEPGDGGRTGDRRLCAHQSRISGPGTCSVCDGHQETRGDQTPMTSAYPLLFLPVPLVLSREALARFEGTNRKTGLLIRLVFGIMTPPSSNGSNFRYARPRIC